MFIIYFSAILMALFMFTVNSPGAGRLNSGGGAVVIAACLAGDFVVVVLMKTVVVVLKGC